MFTFNYIITIHNKEHLIRKVLNGVKNSMTENSVIYPVLDGCTDNTEHVIDEFQKENPSIKICKVYENDVHELLAINAALDVIDHSPGNQLNVILQDDVILNDFSLEKHLQLLYKKFMGNLGIVSMRHGGNLSRFLINKKSCVFPIEGYVETIFGHGVSGNLKDLDEGSFIFKDIAIKSPICIPSYVIARIGVPHKIYRPWDDIAYCFKALENGFKNGVLGLPFISDKEWGTMRNKNQQKKHDDIVLKNLETFRVNNNGAIESFFNNRAINNKIYQIWQPVQNKKNKPRYLDFLKNKIRRTLYKIKLSLKND